jgi:hypothetical protein
MKLSRQNWASRCRPRLEVLERRDLPSFSMILTEVSGPLSGATVTITDNGAGDTDPTVGSIRFAGTVGDFVCNPAIAKSKPDIGSSSDARQFTSDVSLTSDSGGTLLVQVSDTDYQLSPSSGPGVMTLGYGGTTDGTYSVQAYMDPNNTAFNTGSGTYTTGLQGPFGSGSFSGNTSTNITDNGPFALTTNSTVALPAGAVMSFSTDLNVKPKGGAPQISTTPSPSSVTLGTSAVTLTDSAVLSGGNAPTGTITFTLVAPGGATVDTETAAVNGNGTYTTPTGYTLPTNSNVTGTYQWNAVFTDTDGNNSNASDIGDKAEQVPVSPASPQITTTPSPTNVTLGTSTVTLNDTAILSGGYSPTGTITFTLVAPGGGTVDTETVKVNGNGTYTTPTGYTLPTTIAVTGTYQWNAVFTDTSGNNFNASDINDKAEQVPVTPASPQITTTPSPTSVTLGTSTVTLNDTAILSGGYSPTGTITFTLVAPGGSTVDTETVKVTGNGTYTTPTGYTLPTTIAVTGTYQWNATFTDTSGNNFNASDINDKAEQVPVTPASPKITTTPSPTNVTLGTSTVTLNDTAILSGGYSPTGTITFTLVAPGGSTVDTETVKVTGNGTYTTPTGYTLPTTIAVTGTYQWNAVFTDTSGNNFNASDINDKAEQVPVTPASPQITTTPSPSNVTLGTSTVTLNDKAILSGGYSPTGTITFTLVAPGGSTVDTETVKVTGNGTYTTPTGYTLPTTIAVTGTYQWNAVFTDTSGNNFNASDINDKAEQVPVTPASPQITTTPSPSNVTLGTSTVTLNDKAILSGGYSPTGTITFTLVAPGGSTVDTETVKVTGNGTYTTPTGYTLPTTIAVTGTYQWNAVFTDTSGNNFNASDINDKAEQVPVSPASPKITTTPSPSSVTLGTSTVTLKDTAILSGGYSPTGTITFTLVAPGGGTVDTETVKVTGNGTYTTPTGYTLPTTIAVTGTYQWNAVFTDTSGNNTNASDVNDTAEQVPVKPAPPSIVTTPGQNSTVTGTGSFATIGFWHNKNGQALINSFDTGAGATLLGNSLASTYPHLFGAANPYTSAALTADGKTSFAGLTNAQVAAAYLSLWKPSGLQKNTYVQAFAVALGLYAGGNAGTFNVGSNGALFGVANNSTINVTAILTAADAAFTPSSGLFYAGDSTKTSAINGILDGINMSGETPGGNTVVSSSTNLTDSATLSGGYFATGTITFYLMGPGTSASTPLSSALYFDDVTVSGNGTYTTAMGDHPGGYQPTATGTYNWVVVYTPANSNNGKATSAFGSEPWQVGQQQPSIITTTPNYSTITLSNGTVTLKDTATLQDGVNPTGTVTFTLVFNGNTVDTESIVVNGNGNYTTPVGYTLPTSSNVTGTYQWNASYSGDANNSPDSEINDPGERTVVSPASPSITTTPTPGSVTLGATNVLLKDSAALSGGYAPTGTITFTLVAPGGATVDTETVTVNGNGTYTTPTGYTLLATGATGTYQWNAVFTSTTGNDVNASDVNDKSEQVTVNSGTPTGPISRGMTATIGFWKNRGQQVITSIPGTALGDWMATNWPKLFGGFAHQSSTNVATAFQNGASNTYLQAFAVALDIYFDTSGLGGSVIVGNGLAAKYGFKVTTAGGFFATWNIGGAGAAFGVANNSNLTLEQILGAANAAYDPTTGKFFAGDATRNDQLNTTLNNINEHADINMVNLGGTSAFGPADIRTAYGVNSLALDGTGQTIAIIDAYDDPNIASSLDAFDSQFTATATGATLYAQYGPASSFLTVLNQSGQTTNLPAPDGSGGWEVETALDVEWAHAMAPGAQIVLVEANSQGLSDLMTAVVTAAKQPGVSVVSMSWGFEEGWSIFAADEAKYDSYFTTPAGHQGVTFVASTGDYGTADPEYPAFSPNVVAVGGTSLYVNSDSSYKSETGWGYNSDAVGAFIGSGGGVSQFESQPAYQQMVQATGYRTTPDVSAIADPGTGVWMADTYNFPAANPFVVAGGTSLAAPSWAGLFALVNQGRVAAGGSTLGSAAANESQQALYSMPQSDFNVITSGTNGGYNAGAGYNFVTGLGSPVAGTLLPDLASYKYKATSVAKNTSGVPAISTQNATYNSGWNGSGSSEINVIHNVFGVELGAARGAAMQPGPATPAGLLAVPTFAPGVGASAGYNIALPMYASVGAPLSPVAAILPAIGSEATHWLATPSQRLAAIATDVLSAPADTDIAALVFGPTATNAARATPTDERATALATDALQSSSTNPSGDFQPASAEGKSGRIDGDAHGADESGTDSGASPWDSDADTADIDAIAAALFDGGSVDLLW